MTSNQSKFAAELIWCKCFSSESKTKSKEDILNDIESVIIKIAKEQKEIGRKQILDHIEGEVKNLRD